MAKLANSLGVLGGVVVEVDREQQKAIVMLVGQQGTFELPLEKYGKPVIGNRSWSLQPDEVRQRLAVGTHVFAAITGMKIERWCTRDRFTEVVDTFPPRVRNEIERPRFSKGAAQTLAQKFAAAKDAAKEMVAPVSAPTKLAKQAVAA